jgi:hypothetical protein
MENYIYKIKPGEHIVEIYNSKTNYRYTFEGIFLANKTLIHEPQLFGDLRVASIIQTEDKKNIPGPDISVTINNETFVGKELIQKLTAGTHIIKVQYKDVIKEKSIEIRPESPLVLNYIIESISAKVRNEKIHRVF